MLEKNKTSNSLNKDLQKSLGLLLAAAILALVIYFIIRPLFSDSQNLKKEITLNQNLLAQLKRKETQLIQAKENYDELGTSSALIDQAMPNYSDLPHVGRVLEKLNSEILTEGKPLVLESISVDPVANDLPGASPSAWTAESIVVNISFVGNYQAVRDFILKLKNLRHNFVVEQIAINNASSRSTNHFLNVNVKLKYYYFE